MHVNWIHKPIANKAGNRVERLKVIDASADRVRLFLSDLEETRGCSVITRNQRLAATDALARFVGLESRARRMVWKSPSIAFKKTAKP